MDLVHGVDVSIFEPRVDWGALYSQGFRFALVRATSGIGYVDAKFADHWAGARAANILRGAYHYLIAEQDVKQQAQLFISTVGADKGELPPIIDLEDAYNEKASTARIISACKAVIDIVEQAFGRKPMVYSRKTYLDAHFTQYGKAPDWVKDYDLWVAHYPNAFDPAIHPNANMPMQPPGWKEWRIWQYSEKAIIEGVTGDNNLPTRVDLNWFRGTEAELYEYAKAPPAAAPTPVVSAPEPVKEESLKAPAQPQSPAAPTTSKPAVTHTVTKTDTLFGIALKYKTTVDAILAVNPQITNRNIIYEGQIIVIPS